MVKHKRIAELQESLIQQRKELLVRVVNSNREFRETPPHRPASIRVFTEGESGAEEALYNMEQALLKRDLQMLRSIENALQSIKNANYGVCTLCKKEIPIARLKVIPEAIRCVRCQTMVESPQLKLRS